MTKRLYSRSRKRSISGRARSRRRRRTRDKVGGGGIMIIRSNSMRSPSKNPMICRKEKKMLGKDMFYDSENCSNMMDMNSHHHLHRKASKKKQKKKKGKHSRRRKPKVIVMRSRCGNCGLQHGGGSCSMKGGTHHNSQHGG